MRARLLALLVVTGCGEAPKECVPVVDVGALQAEELLFTESGALVSARTDEGPTCDVVEFDTTAVRIARLEAGVQTEIAAFANACWPSVVSFGDTLHAVWSGDCLEDDAADDIFYAHADGDGTGDWSAPVNLTSGYESALGRRASAPSLAISSDRLLAIAYVSREGAFTSPGEIRTAVLGDGALEAPPVTSLSVPGAEYGCQRPEIIVGPGGELHVMSECTTDVADPSMMHWATNASGDWIQQVVGAGGGGGLTVDGSGVVHGVFVDAEGVYVVRHDGALSDAFRVAATSSYPRARIAAHGSGVVVAFSVENQLWVASSDDGIEYSSPCRHDPEVERLDESETTALVSLAGDPSGGPPALGYDHEKGCDLDSEP